jgi:hypothetical protein
MRKAPMTSYGRKGGTGATRGRRAENLTVYGPDGKSYTKRVFFGQRWVSVLIDPRGNPPIVGAWHKEAEAQRAVEPNPALPYDYANSFYRKAIHITDEGSAGENAGRAIAIAEGEIEASQAETLWAWQYLVQTGLAWQLQGFFGRQASAMIEQGLIKARKETF